MSNGLILRKNVDALSATELAALRNGYERMMQISDNRGYNYHAGLHGVPGNYCWHAPRTVSGQFVNLFLPWHRAYILYFERAARDQNPDATLPWWNWTSPQSHANGIPSAFSQQATGGGQPNPLYRAHISVPSANLNRNTRRFPGNPGSLPASVQIDSLLSLSQFNDFSEQLRDFPHNFIHGWTGGFSGMTGGDMGTVATAAWDPIFWSHHSMIDRIWYLWQLRNGVNNVPAHYLPMVLAPFNLTVRDVLSINALGYEYAVSDTVI